MLSLLCGLSDALFYERESFGVHGSFVGKNQKKKKKKKTLRAAPLFLFWRERNKRPFNVIKHSDQAIKANFINAFMNWVRIYVEDQAMFMIFYIG